MEAGNALHDPTEQPWEFRAWLLRPVLDEQQRSRAQVHEVIRRLAFLEEAMAVQQSDLDNLAAALVEDTGLIQTEISNLQAANPNLDLSGLTNAVAQVGQLVPSVTGGGEGPVSDDPSAPVVDGSGDGSGAGA